MSDKDQLIEQKDKPIINAHRAAFYQRNVMELAYLAAEPIIKNLTGIVQK
jgi:hypothetical protein